MGVTAEQELVGVALSEPAITASIHLPGDHFQSPQLAALWEAIREVHADGAHPTPTLVLEAANRRARVDAELLPGLVGQGMALNADRYAEQISDGHRRRGIGSALARANQALAGGETTDRVVAELTGSLDVATEVERAAEGMLTIDEFVGQELPPTEWVIPGLLATGERAIITGGEGSGKTTLMRQMALCAAAGWHPFTAEKVAPVRVLIVDAENPKAIMVRKLGAIHSTLRERGLGFEDRCWVQRYPQGLDLAETRDRLTLHSLCMLTRPDLLVIGPAYKLYVGGAQTREEDLARQVTSTLDGLREEFGFALMLEHHSPHENQQTGQRYPRPIGSSLWRRWPEFGFGLQKSKEASNTHRVADVVHWRGQREDRPWPEQLEQASRMPWVPANGYTIERTAA